MQNRKSIKINEVAKNGGSAWCLRVKVSHATKVPSVVITPSVVPHQNFRTQSKTKEADTKTNSTSVYCTLHQKKHE